MQRPSLLKQLLCRRATSYCSHRRAAEEVQWEGPYLGNAIDAVDVDSILPVDSPGIYLWRRVHPARPACIADSEAFFQWLQSGIEAPLFSVDQLTMTSPKTSSSVVVRPNYIQVRGVTISAGSLPQSKQDTAKSLSLSDRVSLYNALVSATASFGPILYVGESACLRTRIKQHLSGVTALKERLAMTGHSIADVAFFYCTNKALATEEFRTLMESSLTHLLGAPLTFRAG